MSILGDEADHREAKFAESAWAAKQQKFEFLASVFSIEYRGDCERPVI
jgi:hypothetical protein